MPHTEYAGAAFNSFVAGNGSTSCSSSMGVLFLADVGAPPVAAGRAVQDSEI